MKWLKLSWKIGRIYGVEIRLHVSLLFSIPLMYYVFRPANVSGGWLLFLLLIGFVLSILLHELAHAMVGKLVKVEVQNIVLWLLGGFTFLNREPEKPSQRLLVYSAGPLMTVLLAGALFAVYYYVPYPGSLSWIDPYLRLCLALAVINAALFVFNILPAYPLDGGNILHALTELFFGKPTANLITMAISIPVLIGLIALGLYTHDYLLLVLCVFIAIAISTLHWRTQRWVVLGLSYLLQRGSYYYLQGDYDRAIQYLTLQIKRKPAKINNYVGRSVCYIYTHQKDKALADAEQVLALDPNSEMPLLLRGDFFFMEKDYSTALAWYEKARQFHPNSALPYYGCACVSMAKGEFQAALNDFDRALALRTSYLLCYLERSMAHFKLGNLEAAHKDQDAAVLLSEKEALIRAEFIQQVYEGYLDWAEDYYGRVLLKRPRSWYAYLGRADAYRANREYERAVVDYTRALELKPREPRLYLARGKSYLAQGKRDCAAADFQQVLGATEKMYLRRQAQELLLALERESEDQSTPARG